jgi:hypothetical protein
MESKDKGIACSFFCQWQALGSVMMKSVVVPCVVFPGEYLAIPGRISNAKRKSTRSYTGYFSGCGFFYFKRFGRRNGIMGMAASIYENHLTVFTGYKR